MGSHTEQPEIFERIILQFSPLSLCGNNSLISQSISFFDSLLTQRSEGHHLGEGRRIRFHHALYTFEPRRFHPPRGVEGGLVLSYKEDLPFLAPQTAAEKGWKTSSLLKPKVLPLEANPPLSVGYLAKGKIHHLLNVANKYIKFEMFTHSSKWSPLGRTHRHLFVKWVCSRHIKRVFIYAIVFYSRIFLLRIR